MVEKQRKKIEFSFYVYFCRLNADLHLFAVAHLIHENGPYSG